jgi:hypothetical protein
MPIRLVCVPLFIGACVLLYFGSGMLLVVPSIPGHYFDLKLLLYGVLPIVLSATLLATVGWLWTRSGGSLNLGKAIGRSFSFAIAAVLLFWIGLIIIADLRQG